MKQFLLKQRQVFFFAVAGALSAVVEIGTFKIFSVWIPKFLPAEAQVFGLHFPLSNIFSTGLAIIFNYYLSIWFVFERGRHSKKREFAYFMLLSVATTFLSLLFFQLFFKIVFTKPFDAGVFVFSPEILSKIAAIIVVSAVNYSMKKRLIFNG